MFTNINFFIKPIVVLLGLMLTFTVCATSHNGKLLYDQHCNVCHGVDGKGGIGLPINTPELSTLISDDFLQATIKYGRLGRIMPGFDNKLSSAEIEQIIEYIRSWQQEPTQRPTYSSVAIKGDFEKGKAFYQKNCATCHGQNLEGSHQGTGLTFSRLRDTKIAAPSLSNYGVLKSLSDQMILNIIKKGKGIMPTFADKDTVLNDVVFYIRTQGGKLSRKPKNNNQAIFLLYKSSYGYKETKNNIYQAIKAMNFRAYAPRLLEQDIGRELPLVDSNKQVFRFCNFQMLNEFLTIEPRLGVILPCNITVIKTKSEVLVAVPNLSRIISMFNNDQLSKKTEEVATLLEDLIEEALL